MLSKKDEVRRGRDGCRGLRDESDGSVGVVERGDTVISKTQRNAWTAWYQAEDEIRSEFYRVAGQNSEPPERLVADRYLKIMNSLNEFCVDQRQAWDGL